MQFDISFSSDPFHDANKGDASGSQSSVIHIRIQQRSGRKTLTTVQGISDDFDKKRIAKACKKVSSIGIFLLNYIAIACCSIYINEVQISVCSLYT